MKTDILNAEDAETPRTESGSPILLNEEGLRLVVSIGNLRQTLLHPGTMLRGLSLTEYHAKRKLLIQELITQETRLVDWLLGAAGIEAKLQSERVKGLTESERKLRLLLEHRDRQRFAEATPRTVEIPTNHDK